MSRVSEPLFYERDWNYEGMPFEAFLPRHSTNYYRLGMETPEGYYSKHRNTPSWEESPISDGLRNFIGGA